MFRKIKAHNFILIHSISLLFLLQSCGGSSGPSPHDQTFNMGGYISSDFSMPEDNFCKSELRSDISKTLMSNINVVIDMSNGLNEGITYTRDAAMKPILNKTLDKAHFYSVASANDVKELPFVSGKEEDAFIYLTDQNNYGGAWSKLKPGLNKATEDFSTPSLFVTDFILDEGGKKQPQSNINNKKAYTTSSVEYGWAKNDGFKQWLGDGNAIHFFIYPYQKSTKLGPVETNLYYCFFIPKNIDFNSSELFSNLFDNLAMIEGASYFLVDPLALKISAEPVFDIHAKLPENKAAFNIIDDQNNYAVFQYLLNSVVFNNDTPYDYLTTNFSTVNNSPWNPTYAIQNLDQFSELKSTSSLTPDPNTGLIDMASINTYPGYTDFVSLTETDGSFKYIFDKTAGNGFNLQKISAPTYFFMKHSVSISKLKVSEQFKVDAKKLQCVMYADGSKFQHKALYNSIIGSLEEAVVESSAISSLSSPYFYKSYSIVSSTNL